MRDANRNIVLIGFASTGKSTTGRRLAEKLGTAFVDLDDIVERIHIEERGQKRRCREIFSLFGRECFIDYETRALETLENNLRTVIATGGGTPISDINRPLTRALGDVVYLNADVAAIFNRMARKGYPEYLGPDPTIADLEHLWRTRHEIYLGMADLVVNNTDATPEETADIIIDGLTGMAKRSPTQLHTTR